MEKDPQDNTDISGEPNLHALQRERRALRHLAVDESATALERNLAREEINAIG